MYQQGLITRVVWHLPESTHKVMDGFRERWRKTSLPAKKKTYGEIVNVSWDRWGPFEFHYSNNMDPIRLHFACACAQNAHQ